MNRRSFFKLAALTPFVNRLMPKRAPGLAFNRQAFTLPTTGVSIRLIRSYDIHNSKLVSRFDTIMGDING